MKSSRPFDKVYNIDNYPGRVRVNIQHPEFRKAFVEKIFEIAKNQEPFALFKGLYDVVKLRIAYNAFQPFVNGEAPCGWHITSEQRAEFRRKALYFKTKLLVHEDRFLHRYSNNPQAMEAFNKSIEELAKGIEIPCRFYV